MNRIALFLASLSLISCTTKPWMVGSVNDQTRPAKVPGGVWTKDFVPAGDAGAAADSGGDGKGYVGRITK